MFDNPSDLFVKIGFRLEIEPKIMDSVMVQLYPLDFALSMCGIFTGMQV